jgi:acetyltransferase
MSIRNLDQLLAPRSVALIGASRRSHRVGTMVMRNLMAGGFKGEIYPVNPKYRKVMGVKAYPNVTALPQPPDLAVICTPPATVPGLIAELGARGCKAVIVLTAGLGAAHDEQGRTLTQAMLDAAKPHCLRILGPNCVGTLAPGIGLNASFAHTAALRGNLAFVSQSGALVTAVLDWAKSRHIGFSHFISVGERADVDFGDLVDYLGSDPSTRAILLYIESIKTPRKFMSAARAAARNKPIIVVKAGRAAAGARAAASHTGALAGADDVFDAAIRRAGMLRVDTLEDLLSSVETLSHAPKLTGERLALMTNGGGAGVLAADAAALSGVTLAELSQSTLALLDRVLPATWSRANPVDIIGDAPVERYVAALKALTADPQVDAVLFMHAPTAIVKPEDIAAACAPVARESKRPVLSCWLGDNIVARAQEIFHEAGIAHYSTPEAAVNAFRQLVTYRRNQELLMQTPTHSNIDPDREAVRSIVSGALAAGRSMLTEHEAKSVLNAYRIPVVRTLLAATPDAAADCARELGGPVVLKIDSPDITHKSDVGGVALDLATPDAVREAARAMLQSVTAKQPNACITGFTVQTMVRRPRAHELIVGAATDPLFGPVVLFGHGGTAVEVIADRAVTLPPLNQVLAADLVARTRVAKLLAGYRDRPRADHEAIYGVLEKISVLLADIPEITELDINPLLADQSGVLALDARVGVAPAKSKGNERFAIRPYPRELEETVTWNGRKLLLRPILPEDEAQHLRFLQKVNTDDMRMRFFYTRREFAHSELARLTQIDFEREMAFIATTRGKGGEVETFGVVRAITDPDNLQAEMAIILRSDLKGGGLGRLLLEKMIRYCRGRGTAEMTASTLHANHRMLALAKRLGFVSTPTPEGVIELRLQLQDEAVAGCG